MEKLRNQLGNAYNVSQLKAILVAQQLSHKGLKKQQLIDKVIEKHWGIKTTEQVKEEAIQRQLDTVKETFPASRHELFFIIGDNGNTVRDIEEKNQVKVNIDVINNQYIVEGLSASVVKAKKEILSHMNILQDVVKVPDFVKENQDLQSEVSGALADLSKVAGTFIALENNEFKLASLSLTTLENAKRLLNLMLAELNVTNRKGVNHSVIVPESTKFTVLPLRDSASMSLYDRKLDWSKLDNREKQDEATSYQELNGPKIGSLKDIKDILLKPFKQPNDDAITLEARFGNLLFQNSNRSNLTNGSEITAQELLISHENRTLFHPTMPPRQLTFPFIPLTLDGGFHQRSVQLEYINKSLLEGADNKEIDLKKLNIEFVIDEQGGTTLKRLSGIQDQSIIDALNVYGNVDIRFLANRIVDFSDNEAVKGFLIDSCKLIGYSELNAPKSYSINSDSDMILTDITFLNKKRFLVDNNLVSVQHMEQQDSGIKRTEMMVSSVDPNTLKYTKAVERWPSLLNVLDNIARNWDYSSR
ncbi:unnamed protein product [Mucor hiemalis]